MWGSDGWHGRSEAEPSGLQYRPGNSGMATGQRRNEGRSLPRSVGARRQISPADAVGEWRVATRQLALRLRLEYDLQFARGMGVDAPRAGHWRAAIRGRWNAQHGIHAFAAAAEWLQAVERAIQSLVRCVGPDGAVPGRLDASWNGKADWSCLTGNAQLANILLALAQERDEHVYADVADRLLTFIKRTQNCVADDPGLRGGIKGSHPFDGEYGRFEVLNWPTKFFVDALLLRRSFGRPARHVNGLGAGTHVTKRTDT